MTISCKLKFGTSNLLEDATNTVSSETVGFELTNALNYRRAKTWKPTGRFLIDSTNNKVYFNQAGDLIATVANANYATGSALATAVQTAMNAVGSGWTVTYSSNRFTLSRSNSRTVQFSNTTNAIWNTLGYTWSTDILSNSFPANEKRCHYPYEEIQVDFGAITPIGFFAIIGKIGEEFQISDTATISLLGNNINSFASPQYSQTATVTNDGAFLFLDQDNTTSFRYWRIRIQDFYNPLGNFEISNIYLGQTEELDVNIQNEFEFSLNDATEKSESESQVTYFDEKFKQWRFSGLSYALLDKTNMKKLMDIFQEKGISRQFYLCIDPTTAITTTIEQFNRLVFFANTPNFKQVFYDRYNSTCNFVEAF